MMQIRLPWILSRRRLLFAIVVDSVLFALLYNSMYIQKFRNLAQWNFLLLGLLSFWILSSYVIGRYKISNNARVNANDILIIQIAAKTALVLSLIVPAMAILLISPNTEIEIASSDFISYSLLVSDF